MKNLYLYKLRIIGIVLGAALFGFAGTVNAAVVNTSVADSKVEDFGAGVVVNYDVFSWTATTSPGVTAVTMQVRAGTTASPSSDSDPDWTSWTAISSGDTVGAPLDGKRYFQYRVTMTSEDINEVASLNDVQIGWSAYDTNPISLISSPYNSTNAQKILAEMLDSGVDMDPTHIMEDKGYGQIADEGKLGAIIDEVIKSNPKQAEQFRAGKEPILQFLKGMVMKATEGSADPNVAEKLLRKKLK